jgi:uncharacterized protein (DUF58 family)
MTDEMREPEDGPREITEDMLAAPPARPAPQVQAAMTLADGTVLRVCPAGDEVRLTIAGADGMATAAMTTGASSLLQDLLTAANREVRDGGIL